MGYEISDEERERRRERALKLKEEGKIGPQFGHLGGRPRKPRVSELLADEARKDADQILAVLKNGIRSDSEKTALAYLQTWVGIEHEETKLRLAEEKQEFDIGKASREELIAYLAESLSSGPLAAEIGNVIDGTAEDITDVGELGREQSEGDGASSEAS